MFADLPTGTGGASRDVWTTIPGWATTSGPGIELQTNNSLGSIDAHSGDYYVELNSDYGGNPSNSSMAQTLSLSKGMYELSFYCSPRTKTLGGNTIDYGVGSLASGTVDGSSGTTSVGTWTEINMEFTVLADGDYTLYFTASRSGTNKRGGLIDTVSLEAVPLPASALLLLAGMGGLGLMRRRSA